MQTSQHALRIAAVTLLSACLGCSLSDLSGGQTAFRPPAENSVRWWAENSAKWWNDNKHKAEFVPGKGYAVDGAPGYFDADGRLMQGQSQSASQLANLPTPTPKPEKKQPALFESLPSSVAKVFSGSDEDQASRARERFEEGEQLFRTKKYSKAVSKYKAAAKIADDITVRDDALFMVAESYFFSDRYPEANDAYTELIKEFPNSRHLDKLIRRQFAIAHYWIKHHEAEPHWPVTPNLFDKTRHAFDTRGHALRAFDNIRMNDPTGPLADDALMARANAYFLSGRYSDADYYYDLMRKDYPDSKHQFDAHLLGLQCKIRNYQGPDYDQAPLENAEVIVDQLLRQFPDQIAQERERVLQMRNELARARAVRDWEMAEYNAKRDEYGAARFYYNEIIREYPTTALADESRARMKQYETEPDVPEQKMQWLVNLFPDSRSKRR